MTATVAYEFFQWCKNSAHRANFELFLYFVGNFSLLFLPRSSKS